VFFIAAHLQPSERPPSHRFAKSVSQKGTVPFLYRSAG